MQPTPCPWCGQKLDASCVVGPNGVDDKIEPGCFTTCFKCEKVLRFEPGLTLRLAHPGDLKNMPHEFVRLLMTIRSAVHYVNRKANERN
jgi:hypothetical protein